MGAEKGLLDGSNYELMPKGETVYIMDVDESRETAIVAWKMR